MVVPEKLESLISYDKYSNTLNYAGSESSLGLGGTFQTVGITLVGENGGTSEYVQYLQINAPQTEFEKIPDPEPEPESS